MQKLLYVKREKGKFARFVGVGRGTLSLFLAREEGVDGGVELCAPFEEVEFEHEDVAQEGAAELLDERACCCCGAACGESVSCQLKSDNCGVCRRMDTYQ